MSTLRIVSKLPPEPDYWFVGHDRWAHFYHRRGQMEAHRALYACLAKSSVNVDFL